MTRLLLLVASATASCTNTLGVNCWRFMKYEATFFCTHEFCADGCPHQGGCDAWCGLCHDEPLVRDCNGHMAPTAFLGDGYCDVSLYRYDGELIDFNCPEHGCDSGDCQPGIDYYGHEVPCATSTPTPVTPAPTQLATIASIQTSVAAGSEFFDCLPSPRHHAVVRVTCIVTLVTHVGFYCQQAPALWNGVFVHVPSDSLLMALRPGDEVAVTNAYVDEELGSTQLEVADAGDVEILRRDVPMEPVLVAAGALGGFAERASTRCLASAEPYEGLLVRIANASLTWVDQDVLVTDGSGTTVLGHTVGRFDALDAFGRFYASGAAAIDVIGVGRGAWQCLDLGAAVGSSGSATGSAATGTASGANQASIEAVLDCFSNASRIAFAFQVAPRSLHDLTWANPAPTPTPTQGSLRPTQPTESYGMETPAARRRRRTVQSITLAFVLGALVLGVAASVVLTRRRSASVDPGLRAWLSGLDPGDARWPGGATSVEIQVARCPTTFDEGGVAIADCRAVNDGTSVQVAEAVAVEMVPVVGQRARNVEDAVVDEAMDALFRRGLIPANASSQ